jgi:hypothetical protein
MIDTYDQNSMQKRSTRQEVWADVTTLAQHTRHGMIYGHFQRVNHPGYETRFYIYESHGTMQLSAQTVVALRAGLIVESGTLLLPILAQIGQNIYEAWLDFHRSNTRLCFADLIHQDSISISVYDESTLHRFQTPNKLQALMELAMRETCHLPAWSAATFCQARETIYRRYPTPEALWMAITSNPPMAQDSG